MTTLPLHIPLYIPLYLGCAFFLCRSLPQNRKHRADTTAGIIAMGVMLSGFTATQVFSVASQSAMWPRYMLTGAWIHLPLIAFLLHRSLGRRLSLAFSAAAACCAAGGLLTSPRIAGTGYVEICPRVKSHQPSLAKVRRVSGSIDGLLVRSESLRPALVSQVRQPVALHRIWTTHRPTPMARRRPAA